MPSIIRPRLIGLIAGILTAAHGQVQTPGSPVADDGWSLLKQTEQTAGSTAPQSGTVAVTKAADGTALATTGPAAQIISGYLTRANTLQDFVAAHSGDARASEARRLEAVMLLYAGYYGDNSAQKRSADLVAQVRADPALGVDDRFAVASLADFQPLRFQQFPSEPARLLKFEQTARALVAEFSTGTQPYEALLCLAKDCPDDQAAGIARDLLTMNASAAVKAGAQTLLDRYALVGQSLAVHLTAGLAAKNNPALAKGSPVILYPWATGTGGSLVIAKEIAAKAPPGAVIVGVNLDTDQAAARKTAAAAGLPGLQVYDPAGPASPLAQDLKLAFDNTVLITNAKGLIVSVSAGSDLGAKLAAAVQ